jgi:hypothetical protein
MTSRRPRVRQRRNYAAFWDWPNKGTREAGVMNDFLGAREALGEEAFDQVHPVSPDPPDFAAVTKAQTLLAIELTELVDREAVELNVRAVNANEAAYRDWNHEEVLAAIKERLLDKDSKVFMGGPYDEKIVVIHTDEPVITVDEYEPILASHRFHGFQQITSAYVLFSYNPDRAGYPLVKLCLEASAMTDRGLL